MMSSLEFEVLAVGLGIAVGLFVWLPKRGKTGVLAATFLSIMLIGFAQPASAGAVNGDVLTKGQQKLNETLQTTPNGNQYQGIEYADVKGPALSDREITKRVEDEIPKNLKLSVSNGSVRLSGKVSDRDTIQAIIHDIKEIPGVHEIAYDIGLEEISR